MNISRIYILLLISITLIGFSYSSGWHPAEDILSGTFSTGDFEFDGNCAAYPQIIWVKIN